MLLPKIYHAFKANIRPAIYLQLFALSVGIAYFYLPASAPFFVALADAKARFGVYFAVISTSTFGGLLPYLLMLYYKQIQFKPLTHLVFYCLLWAFMGWLVDSFYQFQTVLFGDDNHPTTIIKKVLFDQFVFTVFIASPFLTIMFLFRDKGFNIRRWLSSINGEVFSTQLPLTLISTWIVWIPAVSVIYTMPSDLQIPLFNIVLCMFVLIIAIVNKSDIGH